MNRRRINLAYAVDRYIVLGELVLDRYREWVYGLGERKVYVCGSCDDRLRPGESSVCDRCWRESGVRKPKDLGRLPTVAEFRRDGEPVEQLPIARVAKFRVLRRP